MKTTAKKSAILCILFMAGQLAISQGYGQQLDTLKTKVQESQTKNSNKEQNIKNNGNINSGNGKGIQTVKRVRSSRPDMSKARGARPPSIIRPSGSGVPRGVGRPAGVGRKGGR